jgi:hypothetical protein
MKARSRRLVLLTFLVVLICQLVRRYRKRLSDAWAAAQQQMLTGAAVTPAAARPLVPRSGGCAKLEELAPASELEPASGPSAATPSGGWRRIATGSGRFPASATAAPKAAAAPAPPTAASQPAAAPEPVAAPPVASPEPAAPERAWCALAAIEQSSPSPCSDAATTANAPSAGGIGDGAPAGQGEPRAPEAAPPPSQRGGLSALEREARARDARAYRKLLEGSPPPPRPSRPHEGTERASSAGIGGRSEQRQEGRRECRTSQQPRGVAAAAATTAEAAAASGPAPAVETEALTEAEQAAAALLAAQQQLRAAEDFRGGPGGRGAAARHAAGTSSRAVAAEGAATAKKAVASAAVPHLAVSGEEAEEAGAAARVEATVETEGMEAAEAGSARAEEEEEDEEAERALRRRRGARAAAPPPGAAEGAAAAAKAAAADAQKRRLSMERALAAAVPEASAPAAPASPPKPKLVAVSHLTTSQLRAAARARGFDAGPGAGRAEIIALLRTHGVSEVLEEPKTSRENSPERDVARRRPGRRRQADLGKR